MSAPTTTRTEQTRADDGLALLLDLFVLEPAEGPQPRSADPHRVGVRAWVQHWARRAALWGAGPQGAWRAW